MSVQQIERRSSRLSLLWPPLLVAVCCLGAALLQPKPALAARLLFGIAAGIASALALLRLGYGPPRSIESSEPSEPSKPSEPQPLQLGWQDTLKAGVAWLDAFKRSFAIAPGLYYLGDRYDPEAPLLVTSNHHLTVYLVARQAARFGVRLLVVDTGGINVWCAATKRQFDNQSIYDQLERYDRGLLGEGPWLRLILPKRCCAGVDLRALRSQHLRGVIGPLRSRDLPAYLGHPPLQDCNEDQLVFDVAARGFACLPGLIQSVGYALLIAALLEGLLALSGASVQPRAALAIVGVVATVALAYPLLFPWLPGHRFAVKGLGLGMGLVLVWTLAWQARLVPGLEGWQSLLPISLFSLGISLFIGLTFTGNSPVSAYSKVRREITHFMPLSLLLLAGSVLSYVLEFSS